MAPMSMNYLLIVFCIKNVLLPLVIFGFVNLFKYFEVKRERRKEDFKGVEGTVYFPTNFFKIYKQKIVD